MHPPVIHGLVMARDEWPLLEVSVTHALVHHVDRVVVLDHGSTDGTAAGLARLRRKWGDRLAVLHLGDTPYLQEAATSLLREVVAAAAGDWLYVFDADEFGIAAPDAPLRQLLAAVDPRHAAARYEVHNWVAAADFSAADLDRYAGLCHRAVASVFLPVPSPLLADEIAAGSMNYFDVPFDSKVLVRGCAAGRILAGSHGVAGAGVFEEAVLAPDAFRVAHFPLLERPRLEPRVAQGRSYVAEGFPVTHGWQSQMLARIADAGGLDEFWARHSLPPETTGPRPDWTGPVVVRDDSLKPLLARTLDRVRGSRRWRAFGRDRAAGRPAPASADVLLTAALRTIHALQTGSPGSRQAEAPEPGASPPRTLGRRISSLVARPFTRRRAA